MMYILHILTTQTQRMGRILLAVACVGVLTANAQHTNFTLQVVEFNKVDIRPALCSPHVSIGSIERTAASVTGSENEAVLRWVSGGEAKKITIEGRLVHASSSLHVLIRPVTQNVSMFWPTVAVGQDTVRDLLVGKPGRSEARVMFFDTGQRVNIEETQAVVYTVLDS